MRAIVTRDLRGFTAEQLFAVAGDSPSYPKFLPFCLATRLTGRDGEHLLFDNLYGYGPVRVRFKSRALYQEPSAIEVVSTDDPFELLKIDWRFEPLADGSGCRVSFAVEQRFRSGVVQRIVSMLGEAMEDKVLEAFEARAREVYST